MKKGRRSWALIIVAIAYMIIGVAITFIALTNIDAFGWMSAIFALAGITPVASAIIALIENNPAWILLDLILPG